MPPQENSRNTIIFVVIAAIMLTLYSVFVMQPQAEKRQAAQKAAAAAERTVPTPGAAAAAPSPATGVFTEDRRVALGTSARVRIQTPKVIGSLSLTGARIDDLFLTGYRETLDEDSPPVELFRPQGMRHAYQATLIPRLPLAPTLVTAVRDGLLDTV